MASVNSNSLDLIKRLEQNELAAMVDFIDSAPEMLRESSGIGYSMRGSALVSMMAKFDVLIFNRVIGLGLDNGLSEKEIDEIIAGYRKAGVRRFFIQLSPIAIQQGIQDLLSDRGFNHYNNWVRLYRPADPINSVRCGLKVELIGKESASQFAEIVTTAFGWPDESKEWVAAMVERPGWRHYMAFDGAVPAAAGACFITGDTAWIGFAATREEYRNRGAQSAILARRIYDARHAGCNLINVETAEQTPEREAPSYRNMRRYGFEIAYIRPNYLLNL